MLATDPTPGQVLILAQRGDWPGCEQAVKGLEKVSDTVIQYYNVRIIQSYSLIGLELESHTVL